MLIGDTVNVAARLLVSTPDPRRVARHRRPAGQSPERGIFGSRLQTASRVRGSRRTCCRGRGPHLDRQESSGSVGLGAATLRFRSRITPAHPFLSGSEPLYSVRINCRVRRAAISSREPLRSPSVYQMDGEPTKSSFVKQAARAAALHHPAYRHSLRRSCG